MNIDFNRNNSDVVIINDYRYFRSSRMLRSVDWKHVNNVLVQPIGPNFKGQPPHFGIQLLDA